MAVRLQIRRYNTDGTLVDVLDSWRSLSVQPRINAFGTHTIQLDEARGQIQWPKDSIIQVLRSDKERGLDWYEEYIGFHRTPQHEITSAGNRIFTSYGRSLEDLLHRRCIMYGGNSPQTYKGTSIGGGLYLGIPADNAMKGYVRENLGELADSSARFLPGRISTWVTAGDISQAPIWSGERAYKNLLDVLQEIGNSFEDTLTTVDFRVTITSMSPPSFLFTTGYPMIGQDLTLSIPPLTFSDINDNITDVSYTNSATEEVTAVFAAGSGVGVLRNVGTIINESAVNESPWNHIEAVRSLSSMNDIQALNSGARQLINSLAAQESFKFTPRQTNLAVYGRDYHIGDRMYVRLGDIRRAKRLVGVNINSGDNGAEQLTFEFGDYLATGQDPLISTIRYLVTRVNRIEFEGDI